MLTSPVPNAPAPPSTLDDAQAQAFADALEALRAEVEAQLGAEDAAHLQRIARLSRRLEIVGRSLIHVSLDPLTFGTGVAALWAHKCLELMEIGHMALHGCFEGLPDCDAYTQRDFHWKAPIDEAHWRNGHNVRHHQHTNIAGADPDLDFGTLRLSARVKWREMHEAQPVSNVLTWLGFGVAIQMHVTGFLEAYFPHPDAAAEVDEAQRKRALRTFSKKALRYYGREYGLFPLLAGPFAPKVLLGNLLSEVGRDLYSAATIYCGHVGAVDYPEGTEAKSRARWYVMQAEGARDVRVPRWVSILSGALDRQIEHHLFPRLPPNRLREIAPRVKALCEAHGVRYLEDTWPATLREVFDELKRISQPDAAPLMA